MVLESPGTSLREAARTPILSNFGNGNVMKEVYGNARFARVLCVLRIFWGALCEACQRLEACIW